ncbi:hypothetical protein Dimus_031698 [Dionaea muscipula]
MWKLEKSKENKTYQYKDVKKAMVAAATWGDTEYEGEEENQLLDEEAKLIYCLMAEGDEEVFVLADDDKLGKAEWTSSLSGTHGETNQSELAAFTSYALAFPSNFLALVDTYDGWPVHLPGKRDGVRDVMLILSCLKASSDYGLEQKMRIAPAVVLETPGLGMTYAKF